MSINPEKNHHSTSIFIDFMTGSEKFRLVHMDVMYVCMYVCMHVCCTYLKLGIALPEIGHCPTYG